MCPVMLVSGNGVQGEPADASDILLQHKHREKLARQQFDWNINLNMRFQT